MKRLTSFFLSYLLPLAITFFIVRGAEGSLLVRTFRVFGVYLIVMGMVEIVTSQILNIPVWAAKAARPVQGKAALKISLFTITFGVLVLAAARFL